MSENPNPAEGQQQPAEGGQQAEQSQSFTQADVDRIVAERLKREREATKTKYADYESIKAKAGEATTLEERVAEIEARASKAEAEALRARVAGEYGISTKRGEKGEPSDADLFLTGSDEETLKAQAERLAARESERKKRGNRVPDEGNATPKPGEDQMRDFTRNLFGRD